MNIDELLASAYDPDHGVVNMREIIERSGEPTELARHLTRIAAGSPRQRFFVAAIQGLRGLAQRDTLTREQASVLMKATERLDDDEEVFRTLAVLAVSSTGATVALDYTARKLEEDDDASRWLAFTAIGEVLKHGTSPIHDELLESLDGAAAKESTLRRSSQFCDMLDQIRAHRVKPHEYHGYIGIDVGTTSSVVAVPSEQDESRIELVCDESSGSALIPSVLVFDDHETYRIGSVARSKAGTVPERGIPSIKRMIGSDGERRFFDRPYSAVTLTSLFIRKLIHFAEQKLEADSWGGTHLSVHKAIVTVPTNFHDIQIRNMLEACKAAGLLIEQERTLKESASQTEQTAAAVDAGILLDEASAAVLYYINRLRRTRRSSEITDAIARKQGLNLLVFDYGGGKLDVAVARATRMKDGGTGIEILASVGNNDIGGDQIDVLVMYELLRRCKNEFREFEFNIWPIAAPFRDIHRRCESEGWSSNVWRTLLRVRARWKDLAELAKIRIAERTQPPIDIAADLIIRFSSGTVDNASQKMQLQPLTPVAMNELLQPVLLHCHESVKMSLADAGVSVGDIDYILHTGRQSLLPQIRQCVRTLFPSLDDDRDLLEENHLKVCVAKGAAMYGSMRDRLVAPEARIVQLEERRRPRQRYDGERFVKGRESGSVEENTWMRWSGA